MEPPRKLERGQITRKMYIRVIILLGVLTVAIPLVAVLKPIISGWSARQLGTPEECTAISMRTKTEVRSSTNVTTFVTPDGTKVEVESSYKDYVGRKTVLLVYGDKACRQEFEFPKLTTLYIIMIILLAFCWIVLIFCRVTKRFVVVKE